jgi:hypothetical protein
MSIITQRALPAFNFQAIVMNVKPLLKYFPEIHHLTPEQQRDLLTRAHQLSFGPQNKFRTWRNNLISCALLTGMALLLIMIIGPLFTLSSSATATAMILIVLPGFFFIQHRRYVTELRVSIRKLIYSQAVPTEQP